MKNMHEAGNRTDVNEICAFDIITLDVTRLWVSKYVNEMFRSVNKRSINIRRENAIDARYLKSNRSSIRIASIER